MRCGKTREKLNLVVSRLLRLMTRSGRYRVNNIASQRWQPPFLSAPSFARRLLNEVKRVRFKTVAFYDHLRAVHLAGNSPRMRYFTRCIIDDLLFHRTTTSIQLAPKRGVISEDHFFAFRDETRGIMTVHNLDFATIDNVAGCCSIILNRSSCHYPERLPFDFTNE